MLFATMGQAEVFLAMVLCGTLLGVVFEALRLVRIAFGSTRALSAVMDSVFWLCACALIFCFLLRVNLGMLRLYTLLGIAVGWGLYEIGIAPIISFVVKSLGKVWGKIKNLPWLERLLH